MNMEEISRDLSVGARDVSLNANCIAVSEAAKRQIAAEVLKSKAHLSETRLGASFLDTFDDFLAGPL